MIRKSLVVLLFVSICAPSIAQQSKIEPPTVTCDGRAEVIQNLAQQLENNFFSPEAGGQYAKFLKSIDTRNDVTEDDDTFATRVTSGLQAVYKDSHLRLWPPQKDTDSSEHQHHEFPSSIEYSELLNNDVGYIRLVHFSREATEVEQLRLVLDEMAGAQTLIFDIRANGGGSIHMLDVIFSAIYKEPIELVHMDTRASVDAKGEGAFKDGPTLLRIDGPDGVVRRTHNVVPDKNSSLSDAKVILLTSSQTASAAEHFAFAIKLTKRGTIIGENTAGAARFGRGADLGCGFSAFIPVGQTFDPKSGSSWEADGVKPDKEVNPDNALTNILTKLDVTDQKIAALEENIRSRGVEK